MVIGQTAEKTDANLPKLIASRYAGCYLRWEFANLGVIGDSVGIIGESLESSRVIKSNDYSWRNAIC